MSEVLIPPWIVPEKESQEWLDEGSSVFTAQFAPGLAQRQSYGGLRLKLSRRHTVRLEEKAQLLSILKSTRGRYNALRSKVHFALRGSFSAIGLLTNNMFADGTTGWASADTDQVVLTVSDRILRLTKAAVSSSVSVTASSFTTVAYAPYVARMMILSGSGPLSYRLRLGTTAGGTEVADSETLSSQGLQTVAGVALGTTTHFSILDGVASKFFSDYCSVSYTSVSRCALVDTGTNLLLQSDELDVTWGTNNTSIDDQATTAPDGNSTADSIIEANDVGQVHYIAQAVTVASTALDYAYAVALKAGGRTWGSISLIEGTGSTELGAEFNLSTGEVGTTRAGTNWANVRAYIAPLGDDWYYCCIVGKKTNDATTLAARIWLAEGDNDRTYNGDGTSNIYAWRATVAQSSLPVRLVQTMITASTGTSPTGGALYLKGLLASTNDLLRPDDIFEINGELKQCTAALNSDAAGLGYLQFEPPLVNSPADNDPVIINEPMGKFLVSNLKVENEFGTQAVVTYDLEHIYE